MSMQMQDTALEGLGTQDEVFNRSVSTPVSGAGLFEPVTDRIVEKKSIPKHLSGGELAIIVEQLYADLPVPLIEGLLGSNVLLTLAGYKPCTDTFVNDSIANARELEAACTTLNSRCVELGHDSHFILDLTFEGMGGESHAVITVCSLRGVERISKSSKIPGVAPFDSSHGLEGVYHWASESLLGIKEAQCAGLIPQHFDAVHIYGGLQHGYPDQAIYDAMDFWGRDREVKDGDEFRLTDIQHADRYPAAQPRYGCYVSNLSNLEIVENVRGAGQILEDFYEGDWHREFVTANSKR